MASWSPSEEELEKRLELLEEIMGAGVLEGRTLADYGKTTLKATGCKIVCALPERKGIRFSFTVTVWLPALATFSSPLPCNRR